MPSRREHLAALLLQVLAICSPAVAESPEDVLSRYVDLVRAGDTASARDLWHPNYLAESTALGIVYRDVPCPWDLASPLTMGMDDLRDETMETSVLTATVAGDEALIPLQLTTANATTTHLYSAFHTNEGWRLAGRIWSAGRHWPVRETAFTRIHHQPGHPPGDTACDALDEFIGGTFVSLDISDADLARLRKAKIPYYLCDEATVANLTGYQTIGMADLAGSAVISSHFPHFHELAHLLVNVGLGEVPLYTHPLLQEGVACLLGGRWGRAPATILYTGWVNRSFEMGDLDAVLTRDGFFGLPSGADVAYPLGALLCDLVREEAGWPAVVDLYREVSGSLEEVTALTTTDVQAAIAGACGWDEHHAASTLTGAFARHWPRYRRCGVEPANSTPPRAPDLHTANGVGEVSIWRSGTAWTVRVRAADYPVYVLPPATTEEAPSPLFAQHLPSATYRGERWGWRCGPDNIGVYDFATNRLIATWVASFSNETGACGSDQDGLTFIFDANILPDMGDQAPRLVLP